MRKLFRTTLRKVKRPPFQLHVAIRHPLMDTEILFHHNPHEYQLDPSFSHRYRYFQWEIWYLLIYVFTRFQPAFFLFHKFQFRAHHPSCMLRHHRLYGSNSCILRLCLRDCSYDILMNFESSPPISAATETKSVCIAMQNLFASRWMPTPFLTMTSSRFFNSLSEFTTKILLTPVVHIYATVQLGSHLSYDFHAFLAYRFHSFSDPSNSQCCELTLICEKKIVRTTAHCSFRKSNYAKSSTKSAV